MPNLTVATACRLDEDAWNAFLERVPDSNMAQDFRWRGVLHETFGHEPHYLTARRAGKIEAVLPLFEVASRFFGRGLISVPYVNAGGIASCSPEAATALVNHLSHLGRQLDVRYQELRTRARDERLEGRLAVRNHKVTRLVTLNRDAERMLATLPSKLRNRIRRGEKAGASCRIVPGQEATVEDVRHFHRVFSRMMRDLGTPTYPACLFRNALAAFGGDAALALVRLDGRVIGGAVAIRHKGTAEVIWSCSRHDLKHLNLNSWTHWHLMRWAGEAGLDHLDLGRCTRDSTVHAFKRRWPGRDVSLFWYYDVEAGAIPDRSPENRRFALPVRAWKRLPLPIANRLGPVLTRHLP